MNDGEIEQQLRELPATALPESWRGPLLATARREALRSGRARETWPAVLIYLRHVFARNPVTAGTLAALWLLILVLKTGTPLEPSSGPMLVRGDPGDAPIIWPLQEEPRVAALLRDEDQPPEMAPRP